MESVSTEKPPEQAGSKLWKRLAALGIGALLLYFSFRDCDFKSFWSYALTTDPVFLVLLFFSGVISHLLRAWRWIFLLQPIENRKVSLWNSFLAVIGGYAVNIALPRVGEAFRLVSISRSEKLPWAAVLPTMLIDRMLDLVLLGLFLGFTLTQMPLAPKIVQGGVAMCVCSIGGLALLPWSGKLLKMVLSHPLVDHKLPPALLEKLRALAAQFDVGTKSLTDIRLWPMIAILTPTIWAFYWLNMYLAVLAFHLQDQLGPLQCLVVFTFGSLSVLIPTPGSMGTYHYAVKTALIEIFHINKDLALAYVTVLHLISFILVPCITAAICFGIQSMRSTKAPEP